MSKTQEINELNRHSIQFESLVYFTVMAQPDTDTLSKAVQEIEQVIQSSQISSKLFGASLFSRLFNIASNGRGEGNSAARAIRHLQIHLLNSPNPAAQIFTALLEASGVAPNSATLHRRVVIQAIDVCNPDLSETKLKEVGKLLDIQTEIQSYFGKHALTRGIALDFPAATAEQIKTQTPPLMFNLTTEAFVKSGFASVLNYESDLSEAKIPFESFDNAIALSRSDLYDVKGIMAYYPGGKLKDIRKDHETLVMSKCMWDIVFAVTLSRTVYNASLFLSGILDQAVFHRAFDDEKVVLHISYMMLAVLHNLFSEARSLPFFTVDTTSTTTSLVVHSSIKDTQGKIEQLKKERDERLKKGEEADGSAADAGVDTSPSAASNTKLPTQADGEFTPAQLKEYLKTSQGLTDAEVEEITTTAST